MVDAQRMLIHFNQDHPELKSPAKRVTDKIINHTSRMAIEAGWVGAAVIKDAITGHTAGMMLLRAKKTMIAPDAVEGAVMQHKLSKEIK
ncbi:hypothetical protein QE400_000610 [Xanthomonas sacchari]|uniref:hypothetical protein n=1 Tax=Xanthomonas sacchari TaxID=56458 RepID=UPI002783EC0E|nr:hypothetical protein [Xanthomonas sacchari]MDQ1091197.1 hypothetical protein [Xanthomonas sacchari]